MCSIQRCRPRRRQVWSNRWDCPFSYGGLPPESLCGSADHILLKIQLADSVIAAYGRKPPLIVDEDFTTYFRGVNLSHAEFGKGNLAFLLDAYVPRGVTAGTVIDHQHLIKATTMLCVILLLIAPTAK